MTDKDYRSAIADYIRDQARPPDKFSHQPRLYRLACRIAGARSYDDDVLYAAAWLHDLGVFVGHRPEDPAALAAWDNVAYAAREAPALLRRWGFPEAKIPAVVAAIQSHLPAGEPAALEGVLLRDADILEQLGAVGVLRTVSKTGRDSRYPTHAQIVAALRRGLEDLPGRLRLQTARRLGERRAAVLRAFLAAVDEETEGLL